MTLRCHISFEAIISNGDKSNMYNLLKERDEVLKIQSGCILKDLGDLTIEQKDKRLYFRVKSQIKDQIRN